MNHQSSDKAIAIFRENHGVLQTQQAARLGIASRTLYQLHEAGSIVRESRGLYRLSDAEFGPDYDLVQVSLRVPKAVVCLISALSYHNLTMQIPQQVYIALPIHAEKPRLEYPPLRLFWLSEKSYSAGIENQTLDGKAVKIYSVEKTIADCFKFRNKIGLDIALEALRGYRKLPGFNIEALLHYARIDRVEKVMLPYLEAIL